MEAASFLRLFADNVSTPAEGELTLETPLHTLQQWDSLTILITINTFEEETGLALMGPEIGQCRTVGDIYQTLLTKQSD